MKKFTTVLISVVMFSVFAHAQKRPVTTTSPTYSTSSGYTYTPAEFTNNAGTMHFYGNLGWFGTEGNYLWKDSSTSGSVPTSPLSGLVGLGADFEYMVQNDIGVGGIFRYYGSSDTVATSTEVSLSSIALAGFARMHLPHRQIDFYLGPGFGITSSTAKVSNATTTRTLETGTVFTLALQMGAMFAITPSIAAGFETTRYLPWSSELNGWLMQDYLLKFRFSL